MGEDFDASVMTQWRVFRDTLLELAPHLSVEGLHQVVEELRPSSVGPGGATGAWAPLLRIPALDDERQDLLYELVDLAEQRSGKPWPFEDDRRPEVPGDASLLAGDAG